MTRETRAQRFRRKAATCEATAREFYAKGGEVWTVQADRLTESAARLRAEASEMEARQ